MSKKIVLLGLMISCILGLTMAGPAQAAIINNGNFETGDLTGWNSFGNVGVNSSGPPPFVVINGNYDGFVNTQGINNVCSWLFSDDVFPVFIPKSISVKFKVRYVTDEPITPTQVDDPFHAMLKFNDGNGDVTMVTISSNAVSANPSFSVQDLLTGTMLPVRSSPPWASISITGWPNETHVMQVSGTIPYTGCDPVNIRFDICNSLDDIVMSAAEVDDVDISFVNAPGTSTTWWKFPPNVPVLCP